MSLSVIVLCFDARRGHVAFPTFERAEDIRTFGDLRLNKSGALVIVGEAPENLGYAGGINAWMRPIVEQRSYSGLWILNPDTQPEPDALVELVVYAQTRHRGMVGSRIVSATEPGRIHSRGLRWRPAWASTEAIDYQAPLSVVPDPAEVEARLDAPSGASVFVTQDCIEKIGLMDERYFLYFEDLEWGLRAKQQCGLGYAWRSIVHHQGGTTIGSAGVRAKQSPLSCTSNSATESFSSVIDIRPGSFGLS